ncbi:hypothetical protein LJR189_004780 [Acidovorax delafieldii]|uniref:hypothetical protein n=1 Tax=Acidovorax delafieldii TaxID=47920 RepID=UPI003ECFE4E3
MAITSSWNPVQIHEFSFKNPSGGTGGSYLKHSAPFAPKTALVILRRAVFDYEVGWRMAGISADEALSAYLEVHAHPMDKRVYFSELDLAEKGRDVQSLVLSLAQSLQVIWTGDGTEFRQQPDRSWQAEGIQVHSTEQLLSDFYVVLDADDSEAGEQSA